MSEKDAPPDREAMARLRFSIVGPLLAAPPAPGRLRAELKGLAAKLWRHPLTGEWVRFGFSTIEAWLYKVRTHPDPMGQLRRQVRCDVGQHPSMPLPLRTALREQYRAHTGWSAWLQFNNLAVLAEEDPTLGKLPSYATVRRYLRSQGLLRRKRRGPRDTNTAGQQAAQQRVEQMECRSFEMEHGLALLHADYHHGSRRVITLSGEHLTPLLLAFLDDHSRLVCHAQWYTEESARTFVHGLCQALMRRGLPRGLLTDNGSPMCATEVETGLAQLSIDHYKTLSYTPEMNGKMECFWGQVESRLMAMLEGVEDLTLDKLNEATHAWLEFEYHRENHSEINSAPLTRFINSRSLGRECPDSETLRRAFRAYAQRLQRRSDGTLSLLAKRYEVPSAYRHFERLKVRYAHWDLSNLDLIDPRTGQHLAVLYPLDKAANASAERRRLTPLPGGELQLRNAAEAGAPRSEMAPLMKKLLRQFAATGLPAPYLPDAQAQALPKARRKTKIKPAAHTDSSNT